MGDGKARKARIRNVTFPSLKKYALCLMDESSGAARSPLGVFLPSRRLVYLVSRSALWSSGASEAVEGISENVESNETTEATLDRTGDMQIS